MGLIAWWRRSDERIFLDNGWLLERLSGSCHLFTILSHSHWSEATRLQRSISSVLAPSPLAQLIDREVFLLQSSLLLQLYHWIVSLSEFVSQFHSTLALPVLILLVGLILLIQSSQNLLDCKVIHIDNLGRQQVRHLCFGKFRQLIPDRTVRVVTIIRVSVLWWLDQCIWRCRVVILLVLFLFCCDFELRRLIHWLTISLSSFLLLLQSSEICRSFTTWFFHAYSRSNSVRFTV